MMPDWGGLSSRLSVNLVLALTLNCFTSCPVDGSCSGRSVLRGPQGYISDGPDMYKENSHCEWLIDAEGPNKTIHLELEKMATECSFDFLFVYDGKSYDSPCLATLSGDSLPHSVTAYSGHMLLYLFSDRNYVQSGFEASYKIFDCPWNCSGHGKCVDHKCHCSSSYSGQGCEVKHCPQNCGLHGRCRIHSGQHKCHCNAGYTGQECDLQVAGPGGQGRWYTVRDELGSSGFPKRTSHSAVYTNDCIWVFGGFDLNSVKDDLLRFCVKKNMWSGVRKPHPRRSPSSSTQTTSAFHHQSFNIFEEQTTSLWLDANRTSFPREETAYGDTEVAVEGVDSDDNTSMFGAVSWPAARSGHAMDTFGEGFFIFGGSLSDGSLSNELWFFNISSLQWRLCAQKSRVKPSKVVGHTLTTAQKHLYVVGGTDEDHMFVDKLYRISALEPEHWELVQIWGGVYTPWKLVGHSTVYHAHSGSLIAFGGYIQNSALFSDRSQDILSFHLESRYWSRLLVKRSSRDLLPWQRAFHTGVLMGQYLVVYGGKTHTHNTLEICYNNEIFFYHLGCHVWRNHTFFTSNESMPRKGRFGHAAVVANGNILFIIGGYSGQVLGDVIAYKVPDAIADYECTAGSKLCSSNADLNEGHDYCESYAHKLMACQDDPECVFCTLGRTDGGPRTGTCLHKSRVQLCVNGRHPNSTEDRCPGICPALDTCGACVSHGQTTNTSLDRDAEEAVSSSSSVNGSFDHLITTESFLQEEPAAPDPGAKRHRWRTYTRECSWCVKEAQCQTAHAPVGTCDASNKTASGIEGWWDGLSASLGTLHQCQTEDFPAGLHWLRYRQRYNETFPDEVSVVRKPAGEIDYRQTKMVGDTFSYNSKFLGFVHPLDAPTKYGNYLTLYLTLVGARAEMFLSTDATEDHKEMVAKMGYQSTENTREASRPQGLPVFPNVTRGNKYFLEQITQQGVRRETQGGMLMKTTVKLKWNGAIPANTGAQHWVISSEFLEPYSNGNCKRNYNCLSCLSDVLCSWCEVKKVCVLRNVSADFCVDEASDQSQYLITSPGECPHCDVHLKCSSCVQDVLCEWNIINGHCIRRYRSKDEWEVIRDTSQCPPLCHHRSNCSSCIDKKGECVWCENTRSCLPFSDYVTRYVYGQCTSWRDSSSEDPSPKCSPCQVHLECGRCLTQFGCGWCGLVHNPGIGLCVQGDFAGVSGHHNCSQLLQDKFDLTQMNIPTPASIVTESSLAVYGTEEPPPEARPRSVWAYDQCPDIEECLLGLHDCHANATCINTFGGFTCKCKQGYRGDGRRVCNPTCYHDCVHGWCSDAPLYKCVCKLGWTGPRCDQDCTCNNHSTCELAGPGTCDRCQHWTSGSDCSRCAQGAWGNALNSEGCQQCNCNGHADQSQGQCNSTTGYCYCKDNTEGIHCERCSPGFFGKPRQGGLCYRRCDARTFLTSTFYGAAGDSGELAESRISTSLLQRRNKHHGNTTHCLWIITSFPDVNSSPVFDERTLTFSVTVTGDVECGKNAVYVYDGIPQFISARESESRELGAFCGKDEKHGMTVYATSGVVTIFFEGDLIEKQGGDFKCTYRASACELNCNQNQVCEAGFCVCKRGFLGPACLTPVCPHNCSAQLGQGQCLNSGLCVCSQGFTGPACEESVPPQLPYVQILTDSALAHPPVLPPLLSHLMTDPLPTEEVVSPPSRGGHTLTSCGDLVYLYGGYSPEEGVFDDVWVLNTTDSSWRLVVLRGERLSPGGRYYHSAACIPLEKVIYVFGGFAPVEEGRGMWPSKSMWKFNILSQVWTKALDPPSWMPALAGHSLTHAGSTLLVLIGGFSPELSFNDKVYEYNTSRGVMAWTEIKHRQMSGNWPKGVYGHSAVYDQPTQTIHVFGGYRSLNKQSVLSDFLFMYDVPRRNWSALTRKNFSSYSDLEGRAFHTGVHLGEYMLVAGGMAPGQFGEDLLLYRFGCRDWFRLLLTDSSRPPLSTTALGLAAIAVGDSVYVFGGFAGSARGTLSLLRLPSDVCQSIQDRDKCEKVKGCHFTNVSASSSVGAVVGGGAGVLQHTDIAVAYRCQASAWYKRCELVNPRSHECNKHSTCDLCVGDGLHFHQQHHQMCKWCTNCGESLCVPRGQTCPDSHKSCSHSLTETLQCRRCSQSGNCVLSRLYKRSAEPELHAPRDQYVSIHRCYTYSSCRTCVGVNQGKEDSSVLCAWSETLQECMPAAYVALRCSMGECHYMRQWAETCPTPCVLYTKCADCVAVAGCGWCSKEGYNGKGICLEGGIAGPTNGATCVNGNMTVFIPDILNPGGLTKQEWKENSKWAYDVCLPENECSNNHHTCDNHTQTCIDYESGYACECKTGYIKIGNLGPCEPVCHQGCQNGRCVAPDDCRCDFGYVGRNCSVECNCNKHSDCEDENNISKCKKCQHNTQGDHCQECKPMFVGDATNGGRCIPCREFCNNHTDTCSTYPALNGHPFMHRHVVPRPQKKGPTKKDAVCMHCEHNTTGNYCQECTKGHFRREKDDAIKPCQPCRCNGHSNVCNSKTGNSCQCQNNTETNCESKDGAECWQLQCIQCKEYFLGTPTNGHQCYRQMNADRDYCFDPETQNNCNQFPQPLLSGRTVFFVVQPKYLNVDIRITIDVIAGKSDIFLSNKKDTFQVFVDQETGIHEVYLDKMYASGQAGMSRRSADQDRSEGQPSSQSHSDRHKEQKRDAGQSVRITESVPTYLKLKTTDADYYKLSQFKSMDVVDEEEVKEGESEDIDNELADKVGRERRRPWQNDEWRRDKDRGTGRWQRKKKWKNNERWLEVMQKNFPDKNREELDNLMAFLKELEGYPQGHGGGGERRKKRNAQHAKDYVRDERMRGEAKEFNFDDLFSPGEYSTLVRPLSYNASVAASDKRNPSRRAIVTDDRKPFRHLKFQDKGLRKVGDVGRSFPSLSSSIDDSDIDGSGGHTMKMGEIEAGRLNTYITVGKHNSVLVVRNVQFRLVITLPRDQHDLRLSRFYIILRSLEGGEHGADIRVSGHNVDAGLGTNQEPTRGTLYFRQDQPHIDLFVFFSVFFSCFFLFLAVCVLLWKMKQTLDARRTRQLQEREMECMASRPFARILVLVEPVADSVSLHDLGEGGGGGGVLHSSFLTGSIGGLVRQRSKLGRYHHGTGLRGGSNNQQQLEQFVGNNTNSSVIISNTGVGDINAIVTSNSIVALSSVSPPPPPAPVAQRCSGRRDLGVVPIAIEPTEDGMAGVGTVVFQLPGGAAAPSHLCLGSALTTRISVPPSHHHSHKSASLRRRTSPMYC